MVRLLLSKSLVLGAKVGRIGKGIALNFRLHEKPKGQWQVTFQNWVIWGKNCHLSLFGFQGAQNGLVWQEV